MPLIRRAGRAAGRGKFSLLNEYIGCFCEKVSLYQAVADAEEGSEYLEYGLQKIYLFSKLEADESI